jgi:hypothetical protein
MRSLLSTKLRKTAVLGAFCVALVLIEAPIQLQARRKHKSAANPNDPTTRLFQILDTSYGGKLSNLYLLADLYSDSANPGEQYQRVLMVNYDKSLFFGRFTIDIRSVGKLTKSQLDSYTPKVVFSFGDRDTAKFEKINPGPFGEQGDLYLSATGGGPLQQSPISDDVRQEYDMLLTKYILPAVEKKQ